MLQSLLHGLGAPRPWGGAWFGYASWQCMYDVTIYHNLCANLPVVYPVSRLLAEGRVRGAHLKHCLLLEAESHVTNMTN
jgi:hypothetical protein